MNRFPGEGQVDYILHNVAMQPSVDGPPAARLALTMPSCQRVDDLFDSDHYPVIASLLVH
jgi:hypothetical protein